ncbi:phage virion morphogenesis protein [[Erwinia] mediterraneensis]|uniref:phage virion morphogenesis protein n=1 Tax=[Erwinia] mediterraneensis TaxID=2161819 RepID=UPI00103141FE
MSWDHYPDANSAEVAFTRDVQRIARVHHYGLRDRVSRGGKDVRYAARPLLGVDSKVEINLKHILSGWLSKV